MKRIVTLTFLLTMGYFGLMSQTLAELKAMKDEKAAMLDSKQAEADALSDEIAGLQDQINKLSGWRKGMAGVLGFNLNRSSNWAKNANANSLGSALTINGSGFAHKETDKAFWKNTGILNLGWQKIDPDTNNDENGTNFDRNIDLFNLSSLAGYKLSDVFALSGLGELNTSVGSFLKPGTLDIGLGGTYTGIENLVVVIHPLNARLAFPADGVGLDSKAFLGLKLRADYTNTFANGISWAANLTTFSPYSGEFTTTDGQNITAFEWTLLNTLTFPVYNGIGLGVSFGLRNAAFEYDGTQNFYSVGLSYSL